MKTPPSNNTSAESGKKKQEKLELYLTAVKLRLNLFPFSPLETALAQCETGRKAGGELSTVRYTLING